MLLAPAGPLLLDLPNLPHADTPDGLTEEDNVGRRVWGDKPAFDFEIRDHVELGTKLGILDFEQAAKISGSRFVVLKGLGSRLNRALMQFMLDVHTLEHGYEEVWPPVLVWINFSATRLQAPITLLGFTALSVETQINRSTLNLSAASITFRVPIMLFNTASSGFISIRGTCLSAPA